MNYKNANTNHQKIMPVHHVLSRIKQQSRLATPPLFSTSFTRQKTQQTPPNNQSHNSNLIQKKLQGQFSNVRNTSDFNKRSSSSSQLKTTCDSQKKNSGRLYFQCIYHIRRCFTQINTSPFILEQEDEVYEFRKKNEDQSKKEPLKDIYNIYKANACNNAIVKKDHEEKDFKELLNFQLEIEDKIQKSIKISAEMVAELQRQSLYRLELLEEQNKAIQSKGNNLISERELKLVNNILEMPIKMNQSFGLENETKAMKNLKNDQHVMKFKIDLKQI